MWSEVKTWEDKKYVESISKINHSKKTQFSNQLIKGRILNVLFSMAGSLTKHAIYTEMKKQWKVGVRRVTMKIYQNNDNNILFPFSFCVCRSTNNINVLSSFKCNSNKCKKKCDILVRNWGLSVLFYLFFFKYNFFFYFI